MNKRDRTINSLIFAFGILCILYYIGMGVTINFGQSLLFLWPMLGAVCVARYYLWKRAWKQGKKHPFSRGVLTVWRCLCTLAAAYFLIVGSIVCSAAAQKPESGLDAIVILGAKVNEDGPSGAMRERIAAAAAYMTENPDTVAVASGGQGDDEPMSEAQCIVNGLVTRGIESSRILTENTSTNTAENLRNSFALLPENVRTVGVVTNDFHILRARGIAYRLGGYEICGIPAPSSIFGFVHYAVRECFALPVEYARGNLALKNTVSK